MLNYIVVEDINELKFNISFAKIIVAKDYLFNFERNKNEKIIIFNFCKSYTYQSIGYYVSLIALARNHIVYPSIDNILKINKNKNKNKRKSNSFNLAILLNKEEKIPPSDNTAIEKFVEQGRSIGFNVEIISKADINRLNKFDALFIRETTSIEDHTFKIAKLAYNNNIIVIDDPKSIVRCTNKVYLTELLKYHNIQQPKTIIISKYNIDNVLNLFNFPFVLKLPDSSFCQGVIKINNKEQYYENIFLFLQKSDLIIAQEFIKTNYDWRIGILNNKVIYACKYFMVKNHWQIVNWDSLKKVEGEVKTFKIKNVPLEIINTALKTTKHIGNGFYGVDLKVKNNICYIIEVNDNPSIESESEDLVLRNKLYKIIMEYFLEQLLILRKC